MKQSTKDRKHDEFMAQLLGISVDEVRAKRENDDADNKLREAQAVLLFLEQPTAFTHKECQECGAPFLTSYRFVSVCGNRCMKKSLKKIGIDWNPNRTPQERWERAQIPIPYIIPPAALEVLQKIASEQIQNTEQSNTDSQTDPKSPLLDAIQSGTLVGI